MQIKEFSGNRHVIKVCVVGAGGTGSEIIRTLAKLNKALLALDRKGLFVKVYDDDIVTEANLGRQVYSEVDLGKNKADVMIERVNRFYGTRWQSYPIRYTELTENNDSDIIVICVDSMKARFDIRKATGHGYNNPYIVDCGNEETKGQIWIEKKGKLPSLMERFKITEKDLPRKKKKPSCSLPEALEKQHILVNDFAAKIASVAIWDMVYKNKIEQQGIFFDIEKLIIKKVDII